MKLPIIGTFDTTSSINVDSQRSINWYLEKSPNGRNQAALYPTPGSNAKLIVGTGPIRTSIVFGNLLYVVSGQDLYSISADGTGTKLGSVSASGGHISMATSATELMIVDSSKGYIYTTVDGLVEIGSTDTGTTTATTANKLEDSGGTFIADGVVVGTRVFNTTGTTSAKVTAIDSETVLAIDTDIFVSGNTYSIGDQDFPNGASHVIFVEGYFLVNDPDNTQGLGIDGSFFWSDLRAGSSWLGTNFATAERDPDKLVSLEKSHREVWLFGETSTEIWYNSGGDPVFTPLQSGYIEWGLAAESSTARLNQTMVWLSRNAHGKGLVVQATGFKPQVISTRAVDSAIAGYTTIDDASAFVMQWKGHTWYVLTFPTESVTWIYDDTEKVWFEWSSWDIGRSRYSTHTVFDGIHYMGDYTTGKMYTLNDSAYQEDGNIIERLRRTSHFFDDDNILFYNSVDIEFEYGTGGSTDGQVMLRWSDDFGNTWSKEYWKPIGKLGDYDTHLKWNRLGSSRDRVFEIRITDPIKPIMIAGYAKIKSSSRSD